MGATDRWVGGWVVWWTGMVGEMDGYLKPTSFWQCVTPEYCDDHPSWYKHAPCYGVEWSGVE